MTTYERAEKMVAERLGVKLGPSLVGSMMVEWYESPIRASQLESGGAGPWNLTVALWSEAVRLQEELLKREEV